MGERKEGEGMTLVEALIAAENGDIVQRDYQCLGGTFTLWGRVTKNEYGTFWDHAGPIKLETLQADNFVIVKKEADHDEH